MENLLDLIYETYTESNPAAPKTTAAGRAARARDKEFEAWLREIPGMDILVEDCVGGKIPLWEEIMVRQGSVCCAWEKSAFEEGMKVGIRVTGQEFENSMSRFLLKIIYSLKRK